MDIYDAETMCITLSRIGRKNITHCIRKMYMYIYSIGGICGEKKQEEQYSIITTKRAHHMYIDIILISFLADT